MKGMSTINCCVHNFATFNWIDSIYGFGSRWTTKIGSIRCMRMIFRDW
ncbi:hypothetical protein HanXRQr2_Chr07g0290501 [Helianthus annuus]|uniref:Uncharacterized protein n=1 Tax=Helianthus annuus TaxID=4232 RepID=A0A9K3IKL6_HELAN|nr:hypothetical protein HanXRQr2_Chr07g0290501 [Helianthus annuus]KAJ0904360.1 hypothetical protein HanPSC8_Chr07g0281241 [Helianthus annuus]